MREIDKRAVLRSDQKLKGTSHRTDFFHAAYALLLAFSSLIPLTAIAASPPWAVTGAKSPAERSQEAESVVMMALSGLEEGNSDEEEKEHLIKKRKRQLRRALRNDPDLLLEAIDEGQGKGLCGIPGSHWMLYLGMSGSVLLWGFALTTGILGGANGSTKISLAQANCELKFESHLSFKPRDRWSRNLRPQVQQG